MCPTSIYSGSTVLVIGTNPNLLFYNQPLPVSPITVADGPESVAIAADNTRAYIGCESGAVSVIRVSDNTVLSAPNLTNLGQIEKTVINTGTRAYVTIEGTNNSLKEIDFDPTSPTYLTVTATIPVGCSLEGAALTLDLTRVYVTNEQDNNVSVIRTSDHTEILPRIPVGTFPEYIAINPSGTRAFVTNAVSSNVHVIGTDPGDPLTYNQVIIPPSPIPVGSDPQGVAFDPCGGRAYVANYGDGTVSVIDTTTFVVTTVQVGGHPYGVASHPDGTRVYVTTDNQIAVIRTSDNHVDTYTLPGASAMLGIAITPNGNFAYIANQIALGGGGKPGKMLVSPTP